MAETTIERTLERSKKTFLFYLESNGIHSEEITQEEYEEERKTRLFETKIIPTLNEYYKNGNEYIRLLYIGSEALKRAYEQFMVYKEEYKKHKEINQRKNILKKIEFYKEVIEYIVSKLDCGETKNEK